MTDKIGTNESEPPSPQNIFLVGRDSRGRWVVQDQRGLCGGLFVDRSRAVRFAMEENGRRPQAIVMVPDVFELDFEPDMGRSANSMGRTHCANGDQEHPPSRIALRHAESSGSPMILPI
jgi:hypothetical protein